MEGLSQTRKHQFAVKLVGATSESSKLHFKTLNRKSKQPVKSEYRDEGTGETVDHDEEVKGYELDSGEFLIIEPDEIENLKTEATHRSKEPGEGGRREDNQDQGEKARYCRLTVSHCVRA